MTSGKKGESVQPDDIKVMAQVVALSKFGFLRIKPPHNQKIQTRSSVWLVLRLLASPLPIFGLWLVTQDTARIGSVREDTPSLGGFFGRVRFLYGAEAEPYLLSTLAAFLLAPVAITLMAMVKSRMILLPGPSAFLSLSLFVCTVIFSTGVGSPNFTALFSSCLFWTTLYALWLGFDTGSRYVESIGLSPRKVRRTWPRKPKVGSGRFPMNAAELELYYFWPHAWSKSPTAPKRSIVLVRDLFRSATETLFSSLENWQSRKREFAASLIVLARLAGYLFGNFVTVIALPVIFFLLLSDFLQNIAIN